MRQKVKDWIIKIGKDRQKEEKMTKAIDMIIRLQNEMVMVFDAEGEQIPEYQGQYEDVKKIILRDAPPHAVFTHCLNPTDIPKFVSKEGW